MTLIIAFRAGHAFRIVTNKVKEIEQEVKQKIDKPKEVESTSELIDPTDEIQTAIYEAKKQQNRLNAIK